jgi:CTP synthase
MEWLSAQKFENDDAFLKKLDEYDGVIVPGGFGSRGVEGKIKVIRHCRENKIPYFGLCLGMQLATIEFARNVCGIKEATSKEFDIKTDNAVIDIMEEQKSLLKKKDYGGTMRLGSWECRVKEGTKSSKAYKKEIIHERHRHRYELNNKYRDTLEKHGLTLAGINDEKDLIEIIEIKDHPFFIGVQFHPELRSRPLSPHPLFVSFIKAAINNKK